MRRLFFLVLLAGLTGVTLFAQVASDKTTVVRGDSAQYSPMAGGPDCVMVAVGHSNPTTGSAVFLLNVEAGCIIPAHWHTPGVSVMIVSGLFQIQAKGEKSAVMKHGDYLFLPPQRVHSEKCASSAPCVLFASVDGALDMHYVDPAGNEIPSEKALAAVAAKQPAKKPAKTE